MIFFWWFTGKPYTMESFITPAPYMVMVGIAGGQVYYADVDVPMSPKWIPTGLPTGITDIGGSYGNVYTINGAAAIKPNYGAYDSSTAAAISNGMGTTVATDDANGFILKNGTNWWYSSDNAGSSTKQITPSVAVTSISLSNGTAYAVGSDTKLYYYAGPCSASTWTFTATTTTTGWKQVSFDNQVCAIDGNNFVWCADTNISGTTANWTKQSTQTFSQISLKGGRMVGVGMDNKVYYSDYYTVDSTPVVWKLLETKQYTTAGAPTSTTLTFSKIIMMFPSLQSRRRRFLGAAAKCNSNEEQIGNYCYQPCPSGRKALGKSCPYRVKNIPALMSCPLTTDSIINEACYQPCPPGYSADTVAGQTCVPTNPRPKGNFPALLDGQGGYKKAKYSCPTNGEVSGRYVRIRPTDLISNNKLCIQKVVVKDFANNVLSYPLPAGTGSSGSTLNPKAYASDIAIGGDPNIPINQSNTNYSTYLSGSKWDNDADGGTANRSTGLYWEVDLGAIQKIKTIEVTGCNYVPQGTTSTSGSGVSLPNADQMTGMRVEVLHKVNIAGTPPIASRTLGPSNGSAQIITFNYITQEELIPGRCYDSCPKINGVQSTTQPDHTCMTATGGITNRSITVPRVVSKPICSEERNANGDIVSIPSTSGSQYNWVVDPDNPEFLMTCDNFPGSILVKQSETINLPGRTGMISEDYNNDFPISGFNMPVGSTVRPGTAYPLINGAVPSFLSSDDGTNLTIERNFVKTNQEIFVNPINKYLCIKPTMSNLCPVSRNPTIVGNNTSMSYNTSYNMCGMSNTDYKSTIRLSGTGRTLTCSESNYLAGSCSSSASTRTVWDLWKSPAWRCKCQDTADTRDDGDANGQPTSKDTSKMALHDVMLRSGWLRHILTNPVLVDSTDLTIKNYALPRRVKGQCKCLNPNGTPDYRSSVYNGNCIKCSSNNDVFIVNAQAKSVQWEAMSKACVYDRDLPRTYETFNDAKEYCQSDSNCRGIVRVIVSGTTTSSSGSGKSYYTATKYCNGGGSGTTYDSWVKTAGRVTKPTTGDYTNNDFSSLPIPRAFADDYKHNTLTTNAKPPMNLSTTSAAMDMYQRMGSSTNMVDYIKAALGMASAEERLIQSVERPDTYYSLIGLERRIRANIDSTTDNYGICVGPCDPLHPLHDPIQMIYDTGSILAAGGVATPLYVLYGTTCHDATQVIIDRPSIPATYTPAAGQQCPPPASNPNAIYVVNGTSCKEQCLGIEIDTGTHCAMPGVKRSFTLPSYSCPSGLTKVDNACVYKCDTGFNRNGDFCEPTAATAAWPGTNANGSSINGINCKTMPYNAITDPSSGSVTKNTKKWLCESYDDLNALLAGNMSSGGSASVIYVDQDDLVCVTDDPTTAMYYCQTVPEAVNSATDTKRDDFNSTCDQLVKAYYDLSNNLDILSGANKTATTASAQMRALYNTLQTVSNTLCPTSTGSKGSSGIDCAAMRAKLLALQTNMNVGSSISGSINNPMNTAAQYQNTLITQMNRYHCSRFNSNVPSG